MNVENLQTERHIIAIDRLHLLSLAYYVSGAIGALFVSILIFHFIFLMVFSFIPPSQWNTPPAAHQAEQNDSPGNPHASPPRARSLEQGPPVIVFRIFAGVIGLIIIAGWTLGALTAYAGYCIRHRKHKIFIYVMAGINCIWIPYGTLLSIATILLFQWPEVQAQFEVERSAHP